MKREGRRNAAEGGAGYQKLQKCWIILLTGWKYSRSEEIKRKEAPVETRKKKLIINLFVPIFSFEPHFKPSKNTSALLSSSASSMEQWKFKNHSFGLSRGKKSTRKNYIPPLPVEKVELERTE